MPTEDRLTPMVRQFRWYLDHTPEAVEAATSRLKLSPTSEQFWKMADLLDIGCTPRNWPVAQYFAGRLTFPLWYDHWVGAFRGRDYAGIASRPKALPWPGGAEDRLPLGLGPKTIDLFKDIGFAVLVEGEYDLLSLWRCGIPAIASCTSALQETYAWSASLYLDTVLIWVDRDEAGRKGALASASILRQYGVATAFCSAPDEEDKDVNDCLLRRGVQVVQRTVQEAVEKASDTSRDAAAIANVSR